MLVDSLQTVLTTLLEDINAKEGILGFEDQFAVYKSSLRLSLDRYYDLNTNKLNEDDLRSRFKYETALLHLLTYLLRKNTELPINLAWPISAKDSPFSWYKLPDTIHACAEQFEEELRDIQGAGILLAQASGELLNQANRKHLGEFHTPLPIVEHLIELSHFDPSALLNGQQLVDPACGSGIILALIAHKVIDWAIPLGIEPHRILRALVNNLHGFDIQPFAIELTRSLLLHTCHALIAQTNSIDELCFPNIRLLDPLASPELFWEENRCFRYIIGNPPYMRVKQEQLEYLPQYEEIVNGHANLYQLFLWWAVRSTQPGGIVSFLIPQSMLAGSYFQQLRNQLDERADLISITRMIDRKGVVGDADLQMMAIALQVTEQEPQRPAISVRVTRNGDDIGTAHVEILPYERVVQRINAASLWVVSDQTLDLDIVQALEHESNLLGRLTEQFVCGNGGYVWNQRKELLLPEPDQGTIPLISAASIDPYQVTFPYTGPHRCKDRQYSFTNTKVKSDIHSGPAVLIQRTTPRKVGRRLVAGLLDIEFCTVHNQYFLENHVNFVVVKPEFVDLLYGMTAWLNSDLINFVFQLRNGTLHVSVSELRLLPLNLEWVRMLVEPTRVLIDSPSDKRRDLIRDLNNMLFDWLHLPPMHRNRILQVLSRRERGQ
jgi:adenine-specific DNA-methyltransferase